ncbi:hypothetical protein [Novosphingobium sp. 9]|uniref:hypothetical protein n=1 Tax=Novosphingobium sp. 9 TaxID=2025349 RepID=UPI0021B61355|nr:hypothetical protein [Novosphingobium sp. 9]
MAVLTTLYGLLLGNMIFAPLARMIARGAAHEEEARQDLLDWLEAQVADALPGMAEAPIHRAPVHHAPAQHGRVAR